MAIKVVVFPEPLGPRKQILDGVGGYGFSGCDQFQQTSFGLLSTIALNKQQEQESPSPYTRAHTDRASENIH